MSDTKDLGPELAAFANMCESDMMEDTWGSFTCSEVNTVVNLLRASGRESAAAMVLLQHASPDHEDYGDQHYWVCDCEGHAHQEGADGCGVEGCPCAADLVPAWLHPYVREWHFDGFAKALGGEMS